jgi:hypothetical protein
MTTEGYDTNVEVLPDGPYGLDEIGRKPVAHIELRRRSATHPDALADAIGRRQTNRKPYMGPWLTDSEAEKLRAFVPPGHVALSTFNDPEAVRPLLDIFYRAYAIEITTRHLWDETRRWFRFNERQRRTLRDGLSVPQSGVDGLKRRFIEWTLRDGDPKRWFSRFSTRSILSTLRKSIASGRGVVLLTTPTNRQVDWIRAGRAFARVHLGLTTGPHLQPQQPGAPGVPGDGGAPARVQRTRRSPGPAEGSDGVPSRPGRTCLRRATPRSQRFRPRRCQLILRLIDIRSRATGTTRKPRSWRNTWSAGGRPKHTGSWSCSDRSTTLHARHDGEDRSSTTALHTGAMSTVKTTHPANLFHSRVVVFSGVGEPGTVDDSPDAVSSPPSPSWLLAMSAALPYARDCRRAQDARQRKRRKNSWMSAVSRSGASWADQWLPRSYSFQWTILLWSRSAKRRRGVKS